VAHVTRRRRLWIALGGLGVVLLLAFEASLTILAGILCLLAFAVWGVFLIATPRFLEDERDER
jgi:Ca2+/Na+ antiporter